MCSLTRVDVNLENMVTKFVGRIYPNGEFGCAAVKEVSARTLLETDTLQVNSDDLQWALAMIGQHGIETVLKLYGEESSTPLGSSMLPNSHREGNDKLNSPIVARGHKGISSYGRKLVRNGAYLLERSQPKQYLSFLTLTIPSLTVQESVSFCEEWCEIVRIFIQRLTRALKRAGLPGEVVGCVELQEQRFHSTGVLAPHLHLLFVGRHRSKSWAYRPEHFRTMWASACTARCPWLEGRSFESTENVERVKFSGEGYLGKYMSKGGKIISSLPDELKAVLPSTWYVCSNSLRSRVKRLTWHSQAAGSFLMQVIENKSPDELQYFKPIELETVSGRKIPVGWYGKLTPAALEIAGVFRAGSL